MRYVANIINVIFVDDGNHFKFYSPVAAATSLSSYKQMPNASACRHLVITLTFRHLNGVMGYPYQGLPSCQFSACYVLLFSTYGSGTGQTHRQTDGRTDGRTDRQTDRQRSSLHNTPTVWGRGITVFLIK